MEITKLLAIAINKKYNIHEKSEGGADIQDGVKMTIFAISSLFDMRFQIFSLIMNVRGCFYEPINIEILKEGKEPPPLLKLKPCKGILLNTLPTRNIIKIVFFINK